MRCTESQGRSRSDAVTTQSCQDADRRRRHVRHLLSARSPSQHSQVVQRSVQLLPLYVLRVEIKRTAMADGGVANDDDMTFA